MGEYMTNSIVVFESSNQSMEVCLQGETVWLGQAQIAERVMNLLGSKESA